MQRSFLEFVFRVAQNGIRDAEKDRLVTAFAARGVDRNLNTPTFAKRSQFAEELVPTHVGIVGRKRPAVKAKPLPMTDESGGGVVMSLPRQELSRFLGIVIAMYYRDHGPAHFHAIYGDIQITVEIETGKVNGDFPARALTHVLEWRDLHRAQLIESWSLARASQPLPRIDPLE